ncbi:MAG: aromatic ring-hydroxylating dioxygenase subunit alpha [Nevskia sp.]|nr:aromatic ring-hydroxylating dioxygenase subunit alpha [Nevskia sp.]
MSSVHTLHRLDPGAGARDLRRTGLHPDHWYPLARSRDLKPGKTLGVSFGGEPIVLVRPEQGEVFALEDRCAHRQVPLHLGVVKGERLLCGYHCWAYNRAGECVNVPYLDEGHTQPNGVRGYPCREAYGFVFVFTGQPSLAASVPFPDLPFYSNPQYKSRLLDRKIGCHYSFMHENLMDMNHQYLHRSLMGSIRATLLDVREGDDWLEVDYTFARAAGKQPLGERFMIGRGQNEEAKGQDLMTIRTGYPYQTLKFWTGGDTEPALDLWNIYVPTDREQRSNQTYGLIMIRRPGIPGLIHLLWPFIFWFTEGIFSQDRKIVEAEQRAYDQQGADLNQEVFPAIRRLKALLARRGVPLGDCPV